MTFDQRAYVKARRGAARERGDCQQCTKRPRVDGRSICQDCFDHNAQRAQRDLAGYRPVDEILERPSIRILRAIRWFDAVTATDLLDAMDITEDRAAWAVRLAQLARDGLLSGGSWRVYRITPAGRAWLARQLARADVGREAA